jgi:hypothetical protein
MEAALGRAMESFEPDYDYISVSDVEDMESNPARIRYERTFSASPRKAEGDSFVFFR